MVSALGLAGRSLRTRLIAAFAVVITLTLLIVGVGFLFIMRQYQAQRELLRLGALAGPVTFQVRALEQQGASAAEIVELLARQADDLDVRIALARPDGTIFHDTEGSLVGQRIGLNAGQRFGQLRRASLMRVEDRPDGQLLFVATTLSPPGSVLAERFLGRQSAYVVALASQPWTLLMVLQEMAPRLLVAALLSLVASVAVAWVLAASIARPLARMTRAAEAMARGQYDQAIPSRGADEVGRLATAFNTMAREVARSNRALRDFLANVSHDLRTPLTSIQGFSQAMVDGAVREPRDYADAARIINEEAERMRRLVEDLLELSKLESGQVTLELAPIDLTVLVHQVGERMEHRAGLAGVDVAYQIGAAPMVYADGRRLERVLENLLENAVKHTPAEGRVTIAVGETPPASASVGREEAGSATVTIHNSGSWIPAEDLSRIFERFYQVDKSRVGSSEGSGLGLAIARELVQVHGGQIVAASSHVDGTRFTIHLPVTPALDLAEAGALGSGPTPRRESSAVGVS